MEGIGSSKVSINSINADNNSVCDKNTFVFKHHNRERSKGTESPDKSASPEVDINPSAMNCHGQWYFSANPEWGYKL